MGIDAELPQEWNLPLALVPGAPTALNQRLAVMWQAGEQWGWPLVLKPAACQRGVGVRKVADLESAHEVLLSTNNALVAQAYHPGPYEAGIFYMREPGQAQGRIFSITDKVFPLVVGNGQHTLRDLVRQHQRYRLQESTFAQRFGEQFDEVPDKGSQIRLAFAGNHCQGTLFQDGGHLITPALVARMDDIARRIPGFHFGRFDIRDRSAEQLRQGKEFTIVELNGVMSESTNLYDPTWSVWRAYKTLFTQW